MRRSFRDGLRFETFGTGCVVAGMRCTSDYNRTALRFKLISQNAQQNCLASRLKLAARSGCASCTITVSKTCRSEFEQKKKTIVDQTASVFL
jgi:hypothetical protein